MVPSVKGLEMRYTNEGELVAISNVHIYDSCSTARCYNKKLNSEKTCTSCGTSYTDDIARAVVCNVGVMIGDSVKELTLFRPQVENLIQKPLTESTNEELEELIHLVPHSRHHV